ncbi:aldehyde dehydrogenase family protein [Nocardia brasiliensis]|uniref:aldehyde dehydrogenase family protein n=1 Tax=Nocardia brasiliensis TaxID=37326 RepID=UPI003D94F7A4
MTAFPAGWATPQDARPIDPTTLRELEPIPATAPPQIDRAVAIAAAAQQGRWAVDAGYRQIALWRWADALAAHDDELIRALVVESGKPVREARVEVASSIDALRYNSGLTRLIDGRAGTLPDGSQAHLVREPVGVSAFIAPWNWPLLLLFRDLAPALAAGVAALVKPAPQTTAVTRRALEIGYEAGLDPDIVHLVVGAAEVGHALVTHPSVRAVAFTGSTPVGAQIRAAAAPDMTRTLLELGGKASMVIFADADLDAAAETAARASVITAGQMCMACTRVLVQRSAFEKVRDHVVDVLHSLRVGDPSAESSDVGPLISAGSLDRLTRYFELARSSASLLTGGQRIRPDGLPGYFVTPAAVTDVDVRSPLVQDDLFAPLLTVEQFDNEPDAVELANATPFGLAASVWTADSARGWRVARALRAGTVWVNGYNHNYPEMPSGGYGSSGLGRTRGVEGMHQFTELKHVHFEIPTRS